MNKKIILKSLLFTAALLGLMAAARADDPVSSKPVPVMGSMGLLGQTYAGLTYTYLRLDDSPVNADSFKFEMNQSLSAGLDGVLYYDWTQSGAVLGSRLKQQTLGGALRAFSTSYGNAKPYVEAGAGYAWSKFAGVHDNSFVWDVAVGVELQAAPALTITPYIKYEDAPDLAGGSSWNFGAKANYWVNSQWAVTVGASIDDSHNKGFTIGTNFRF